MNRRPVGFESVDPPAHWTEYSLSEVLEEVDVRAGAIPDGSQLPVLSLTKERGLIPQSERFSHRVATEDISKYKVLEPGIIVYNPMVLWEGAVQLCRKNLKGVVSPVYLTWTSQSELCSAEYMDQLLRSPAMLAEYERLATGVVKRRRVVHKASFMAIRVALPPKEEQIQAMDVIGRIQRSARECSRTLLAARELKRSLMDYLITFGPVPTGLKDSVALRETDFGKIPDEWVLDSLGNRADVQTGVAKGRRVRAGVPSQDVPYLRVANVQDGYLDLREIKTLRLETSDIERFGLKKDDVLMTEGGDFDKLGRGHLWEGSIDVCVHQNHLFAVRAHEGLHPKYLAYLIQTPYARRYFLRVAHRTTKLASINSTKLKAFPIPIPPMEEQDQIVEILDASDRKIRAEVARRNSLDSLQGSLTRDLLAGQFKVQ